MNWMMNERINNKHDNIININTNNNKKNNENNKITLNL